VPELRGLVIIDAHLDGHIATFEVSDAAGAHRRLTLEFARAFDRYAPLAAAP
jgi:hypothetical protein